MEKSHTKDKIAKKKIKYVEVWTSDSFFFFNLFYFLDVPVLKKLKEKNI